MDVMEHLTHSLQTSYKDCHQNFGPENFSPPVRNFQWKNVLPGPFFFSKNGPSLEIWSESCKFERQSVVHLIHVRKSFPCLLLLQFHTSLVPIWSLSLTGWEVLSWDSARR